MDALRADRPSWDRLYEIAASQDGLFSTQQAAEAGYSSQLLLHYIQAHRIVRVRRGVYRLIHFPAGEHENLTELWLWSEQVGVFSHETALMLHDLSDALPAQVHISLPSDWRRRRFRVPPGVVLHHADVSNAERTWVGAIPVTSIARTLVDCARDHLSPDLLHQAARQALRRGLVARADIAEVEAALRPFGELS